MNSRRHHEWRSSIQWREQYAVELYPFVAVAFAADAGTGPIVSRAIEIATAYSTGPRPKSFMPPGYTVHGMSTAIRS